MNVCGIHDEAAHRLGTLLPTRGRVWLGNRSQLRVVYVYPCFAEFRSNYCQFIRIIGFDVESLRRVLSVDCRLNYDGIRRRRKFCEFLPQLLITVYASVGYPPKEVLRDPGETVHFLLSATPKEHSSSPLSSDLPAYQPVDEAENPDEQPELLDRLLQRGYERTYIW
jgi:hypothetical protein